MSDRAIWKFRCEKVQQVGMGRGHDQVAACNCAGDHRGMHSPGHKHCNKAFGAAPTQAASERELPEIVWKRVFIVARVPLSHINGNG